MDPADLWIKARLSATAEEFQANLSRPLTHNDFIELVRREAGPLLHALSLYAKIIMISPPTARLYDRLREIELCQERVTTLTLGDFPKYMVDLRETYNRIKNTVTIQHVLSTDDTELFEFLDKV